MIKLKTIINVHINTYLLLFYYIVDISNRNLLCHIIIKLYYCIRATILQHESSQFGKVNTESVAKPAVMRAGAEGGLFLTNVFTK